MNLSFKKWVFLGAFACLAVADAQTNPNIPFRPHDFQTRALFELVVKNSSVLKPSVNSIVATSAFVKLVHRLKPAIYDRLEIFFFTRQLAEADRTELLKKDARGLRTSDYAALVVSLNKENKVSQVDLNYVVPGTTVVRTLAWKPEDLAKYFSDYKFDGKRFVLKSKGTLSEPESEQESVKLSWTVDMNLPVYRETNQ
jgi:hypothetical protein